MLDLCDVIAKIAIGTSFKHLSYKFYVFCSSFVSSINSPSGTYIRCMLINGCVTSYNINKDDKFEE